MHPILRLFGEGGIYFNALKILSKFGSELMIGSWVKSVDGSKTGIVLLPRVNLYSNPNTHNLFVIILKCIFLSDRSNYFAEFL